jgi:methionyl-tRNA formyltransferase
LEEEADAGAIVLQRSLVIALRENATSLFEKIASLHEQLGRDLVDLLSEGRLTWTEQVLDMATTWPKRRPEDGLIDFTQPVAAVDRLVRALTRPYPGAFFFHRAKKIVADSGSPAVD